MNEALRRSAAHVLVADVDRPGLDADALHHLSRVLRLRRGQPITVTDGGGRWRAGAFTGDDVEVAGPVQIDSPSDPPLTSPSPRRKATGWSGSSPSARRSGSIAWCCSRPTTPSSAGRRIASSGSSNDCAGSPSRRRCSRVESGCRRSLGRCRRSTCCRGLAVAEPGGPPLTDADTAIAIGPEGGWSSKELEVAASMVSLGPNVLRVETAAVAAAAVLMVSLRT